jgi:hypothetical protein
VIRDAIVLADAKMSAFLGFRPAGDHPANAKQPASFGTQFIDIYAALLDDEIAGNYRTRRTAQHG